MDPSALLFLFGAAVFELAVFTAKAVVASIVACWAYNRWVA